MRWGVDPQVVADADQEVGFCGSGGVAEDAADVGGGGVQDRAGSLDRGVLPQGVQDHFAGSAVSVDGQEGEQLNGLAAQAPGDELAG